MFTSAPCSINSWATCSCPFSAADINAEYPWLPCMFTVHIRTMFNQQLGNLLMSILCCINQCRISMVALHVHLRTMFNQRLDKLFMSILCRFHQSSHPFCTLDIHIHAPLKQQLV
eukprot:TRINITY_DN3396_c0_g1_i4.p2 TRINITY_DN3396_c0_g1~~TRINITY_DN3396_c0_g1_i4.p2  ORF type:complete len:115 (-),score=11.44 TRINITY_DN3396_c0_g1_i4:197-541(-)